MPFASILLCNVSFGGIECNGYRATSKSEIRIRKKINNKPKSEKFGNQAIIKLHTH